MGIPRLDRTPDRFRDTSALAQLEMLDARQARVVEMRFFAGLELNEIAVALDVSERTVKRD